MRRGREGDRRGMRLYSGSIRLDPINGKLKWRVVRVFSLSLSSGCASPLVRSIDGVKSSYRPGSSQVRSSLCGIIPFSSRTRRRKRMSVSRVSGCRKMAQGQRRVSRIIWSSPSRSRRAKTRRGVVRTEQASRCSDGNKRIPSCS